jgi:methylase of polypeptide subunit release factors
MRSLHVRSLSPSPYRLYGGAARLLRSQRAIYRLLFGHWPAREVRGQLWDWTTLALAAAMRRHVRPSSRVLDMGTGPAGVLAVYAKHRLGCAHACGVDHLPELLSTAALTAEQCGVEVDFRPSMLFSAVEGRFDVIAFNAPYIPVGEGRRLGVLQDLTQERRWGGGMTGLDTVQRFLREAPGYLLAEGRILLGVNHFYLSPEVVRDAVAGAGLLEFGTIAHRLSPSSVYLLGPRIRKHVPGKPQP